MRSPLIGQATYDTLRIGALSSNASSDNISRSYTYTYDDWGRVSTATTTGPQQDLTLEYEYDAYDRLQKVTYPEPGYSVFPTTTHSSCGRGPGAA